MMSGAESYAFFFGQLTRDSHLTSQLRQTVLETDDWSPAHEGSSLSDVCAGKLNFSTASSYMAWFGHGWKNFSKSRDQFQHGLAFACPNIECATRNSVSRTKGCS
jgi:hypothetical protein